MPKDDIGNFGEGVRGRKRTRVRDVSNKYEEELMRQIEGSQAPIDNTSLNNAKDGDKIIKKHYK